MRMKKPYLTLLICTASFLMAAPAFSRDMHNSPALDVLASAQQTAPVKMAAPTDEAPRKGTFGAKSFTLINGMRVVVIPNHRIPAISHSVWYLVGGADEAAGKSGLAHFLEHLMFKGTEKIPPGEFATRIKETGGNNNAFTSSDYTAYYQNVTREYLPMVMEMEADRMRGLTFIEDEVLSEKQVVIEERKERVDNNPRAALYEQMMAVLFPNHPYGLPVIGWAHELEEMGREDAIKFYNKWYAPNNAILIVSGDVTAEELKNLAENTYGTIPARNVPARDWPRVPALPGRPAVTMHHPSVQQPVMQRMYRVPSLPQDRRKALAFQVLEEIMSGGASTRLYRALVVEQKIATAINLSYHADTISDTTLTIGALPSEGTTMDALNDAINAQLRLLIKDGVDESELKEAIQRLQDKAIYARDSISGPAMIFGHRLASGGTLEDVEFWPEQIEKITAQNVRDVAAQYLDPDRTAEQPFVTGYLLPMVKTEEGAP